MHRYWTNISFRNGKGYLVTARVDVEIDTQALAQLIGKKAATNKTRKSKLLGGIVTVDAQVRP